MNGTSDSVITTLQGARQATYMRKVGVSIRQHCRLSVRLVIFENVGKSLCSNIRLRSYNGRRSSGYHDVVMLRRDLTLALYGIVDIYEEIRMET